jgi:hypothetical protein
VESRLFGSDQTDFWSFGRDVDLGMESAIVGADFADVGSNPDQGAAYVFVLEDGSWSEQERLVAGDGASGDRFGRSVAVSGDIAIVGADLADIDGEIFEGALYVFERTGDGWAEVQKLTGSDGDAHDHLGASAVLQGVVLAAGAPLEEGGITDGCQGTGAVYVFESSGGVWSEAAKLFDRDGVCSDLFGEAVDLDGDTIVVGAPNAFVTGPSNRGAAYVYRRVGEQWQLEQRLLPWGPDPNFFGASVALDGDTLLVGAEQEHVNGALRQGAAYVFRRDGTSWIGEQRLVASDGHEDSHFGIAAALLGHVAIIGAELEIPPGSLRRGVVYEYRYDGGTWNEVQRFAAPEGQGLDSFGRALSLTNRHLLVANKDNLVVSPPGGTAWIFGRPTLFADGFESGGTGRWSQTVQ